jgi:hypothetical protein
LTRLNDDSLYRQQRISIIGIVRDISCLSNLDPSTLNEFKKIVIEFNRYYRDPNLSPLISRPDPSTLSNLKKNVIEFKRYSREEIFDILKHRTRVSLIDKAISDELLVRITDLVHEKGDIRFGLNLIWKAADMAENKGLKRISTKCVRLATQEIEQSKRIFKQKQKHRLTRMKESMKDERKKRIGPVKATGMTKEEGRIDPSEKDPRGYDSYRQLKQILDKNPTIRKLFLGILEEMEGEFTFPEVHDRFLRIERTDNPEATEKYFTLNFDCLTATRALRTHSDQYDNLTFTINDQAWVKALIEDLRKEE